LRAALAAAILALGALSTAVAGFAARDDGNGTSPQVKGAHYSGALKGPNCTTCPSISFDVSNDGTELLHLKVSNPPSFCQGGGMSPPNMSHPVSISAAGKFVEAIGFVTPIRVTMATMRITGQFHADGSESGQATVFWSAKRCNGTDSYSTRTR
jgi:hypothetical protein